MAATTTSTSTGAGDAHMIAACGLYCGCCSSKTRGKCIGCAADNTKTWCDIRKCCVAKGIQSCAQCADFPADPKMCPKFHNAIGRVIGYCLGSDRAACIQRIREVGPQQFADEMQQTNRQTIKKSSWNPWDCCGEKAPPKIDQGLGGCGGAEDLRRDNIKTLFDIYFNN
ncbi:hypothetical protein Pelo_1644 [Pelomyxa schiedti]|nr:hypothetical protein Pelo_1644 [Pelomyxa schiedti]